MPKPQDFAVSPSWTVSSDPWEGTKGKGFVKTSHMNKIDIDLVRCSKDGNEKIKC